MSFEPLSPAGLAVQTSVSPARLDVMLAVPCTAEVTIGLRVSFTTGQPSPDLGGDLDPAEGELAGDERGPLAIVRRFWNFILDNLALGFIRYDLLDPVDPLDWVVENGWCDCKIGSILLIALCRARAIPARLVAGYVLYERLPHLFSGLGAVKWPQAWHMQSSGYPGAPITFEDEKTGAG